MSAATSPFQFTNRFLFLVTMTVLSFFPLEKAGASTTMSPDGELRKHNLNNDEVSLLDYLESGLPDVSSLDFDRRWALYRVVVTKVGELASEQSVLPLIHLIETEPTGTLEQDLLLSVASGDSWTRWDFQRAKELADLRGDAAFALARIGDDRALPVLTTYLERLTRTVEADLSSGYPKSGKQILWSYGAVCKAITALGSKAGIDAMVASLGCFTEPNPEMVVYNLRICTGQSFGPEPFLPSHRWPAVYDEWRAWWRENRETFEIDREKILRLRKPELPRPEPTSLRDHVVAAETRTSDYEGTGYGKRSAEWLETHCGAHSEALKAIVEDRNEDSLVRREAMDWYAVSRVSWRNELSGESSVDLLSRYAIGVDIYSENNHDRMLLQNQALKLIEKHHPEAIDDVAKRCVVPGQELSSNAVYLLMKSEHNHAFVAENYASISDEGRRTALHVFLDLPDPIGRSAFIAAVKSTDLFEALYGVLGVEKFGLEEGLPDESRAELAAWRENPMLRILMLERIASTGAAADSTVLLDLLSKLSTPDAKAAWVYRRAWYMLPPEHQGIAMEGLLHCVAAYKESRGG